MDYSRERFIVNVRITGSNKHEQIEKSLRDKYKIVEWDGDTLEAMIYLLDSHGSQLSMERIADDITKCVWRATNDGDGIMVECRFHSIAKIPSARISLVTRDLPKTKAV